MTERIVFDAEPLVAHAAGELGSNAVVPYLDAVAADDASGYVNCVTLSEVRYVLARTSGRQRADEYVDWLEDLGVETVGADELWTAASEYVLEYNPALGDAFALATAEHVDGTLLVGGDDDYEEVTDVPIERFRDGAG